MRSAQDQSETTLKEQKKDSEVPAGPSYTQSAPSCSIDFCFTAESLFPTIGSWPGTTKVAEQLARPQRSSVVLSESTKLQWPSFSADVWNPASDNPLGKISSQSRDPMHSIAANI